MQGLRAVRVFRFRCLGFRIAKPGPGLGGAEFSVKFRVGSKGYLAKNDVSVLLALRHFVGPRAAA